MFVLAIACLELFASSATLLVRLAICCCKFCKKLVLLLLLLILDVDEGEALLDELSLFFTFRFGGDLFTDDSARGCKALCCVWAGKELELANEIFILC